MQVVFDSDGIPVGDRVEAWRDATAASMIPTVIGSPEPAAFTARLGALPLGPAQVTSLTYTSLSTRRTPRLIHRSDPEHYLIVLVRGGEERVGQGDRRTILRAGDLMVYDSSQPFEAHITGETSPAESVVLQFPKGLLPLSLARVADLCAAPLSGTRGIGRVLAQHLLTVTDEHGHYSDHDAVRLGHAAIDLTTATLAHHLERGERRSGSPSHVLYLRIIAFIDQHLRWPDLRPQTIADAHRISVRYLHRIFQLHHDTSLHLHIRTRRLEHARRDLADPAFDRHTIAAVGARWGFVRPADFSRAFLRHTGASPSSYRAREADGDRAQRGTPGAARSDTR